MWFQIFQAVLFVASVVYQNKKQKKLKQQQAALAEERKGFTITTSGEAVALPVVYGKNYLGGIAVKHSITSTYVSGGAGGSSNFNQGFTDVDATGTKNEFLHIQHALCHDGIQSIKWVKVNNLDYNDPEQRFNHLIRCYRDGGTADATATANGVPSTNTFTGTAYASSTFKLDRDDPQYNGTPEMGFLVLGRRVRSINLSAGVYSLSTEYTYSNNPALCLLDYLLNTSFGRGLSVDEVDLQSFYEAQQVCGTVVTTRTVSGAINDDPTGAGVSRAIPLYECNITLDTKNTIRDNIEAILGTMALAELTWGSDGKYKLLVEYPTSLAEQNALVDPSHYFTDDDIVRDKVELVWPSASDRLNQVTISFLNEHEDFKSDSATWPPTGSTAHTTFLTEDNNQPFRSTLELQGTTDPYHALASAEQLVREARSARLITLTITKRGLSIEPGDFINISSEVCNISSEVYRVESIQVNSDFTVKITATHFDFNTLAWNVNDDIAYAVRPVYDFKVEPVTDLTYTSGSTPEDSTAVAELTWTAPIDGSFKYIIYYTVGGTLRILGEAAGENFLIQPRAEWSNGQSVTFTVKAQTPLGRLSAGRSVVGSVTREPLAPTSFGATEALYQTNKASGVKARVTLSWSEAAAGGVAVKDFKVEGYRTEDGGTYRLLGYTVGTNYIFDDVRSGNWSFRITPVSWFGYSGTPLVGTKLILGLSAIPSDPTGFTSKVTDSGILLTWDTPTDLDVVSGGTTEIRYVRNDVVTPKWEIAQTIVNNISGSTTTAALPIAPGYYLIKHIDSSGNPCANAAILLNSFVGPDYNVITTISEDPTFAGAKTNCSVVSSNLEKDALATSMAYSFSNQIDLGSVEDIRLVPNLTAVITDGVTTVADYDPISSVTRFAGPIVDASVRFEVRTTDDDPSASPVWSDWETFTVGNYRHRGFQFRIEADVADPNYTVSISELSLTADKADVTKRGTSTTTGGNTTVTFPTPFYGGIGGADVPYIGLALVGDTSGSAAKIVSVSSTGFVYSVSGGSGTRAVNWVAVGQ